MSNFPSSFPMINPLVSVIIPAYNAVRYLGETLDSVRAQTYRDFEIIVVDNGSTDETAVVAQGRGDVRYEFQNHSDSPPRGRGVELAHGELICFLDADDLWHPHKLARQVSFYLELARSSAPTLIYAHARQFLSPELDSAQFSHVQIPAHPQPAHLPGTLLLSPADFHTIGPYISELSHVVDWHLRAVDMGAHIHMLPEVLLLRRVHHSNLGRTQIGQQHHYARALKASLDRRRAQAKQQQSGGEL